MERVRRLNRLWSWLPAFRAVAETEHVHRAAGLLRVSPSALSRAIRLLEHDVGRSLFERSGRQLRLNSAGQDFLARVRSAMRLLDDGVSALDADEVVVPLHVSAPTDLALGFVVPAVEEVIRRNPRVVPALHPPTQAALRPLLLRGEIDVAFGYGADTETPVVSAPLGKISLGVYCGPGHALWRASRPSIPAILAHPFVEAARAGVDSSPWPAHLERRVGARAELAVALQMCGRGRLLIVLPDNLARRLAPGTRLRRLPLSLPAPTVFAVRRVPLGPRGIVDDVVDAARVEFTAGGKLRTS